MRLFQSKGWECRNLDLQQIHCPQEGCNTEDFVVRLADRMLRPGRTHGVCKDLREAATLYFGAKRFPAVV